LKSKLSITLWDGKKVTAHAVDSGPKGNNINILVSTAADAYAYGVKSYFRIFIVLIKKKE
jgi:hypothetical protein